MQAGGFAWMVRIATTSTDFTAFVAPFIIAGVGISMALPCVTAGGLNAVPPELLGKAAGTLNTMQQFGAVFGVAVVTAVFNAHGSLANAASVTSGYRAALTVAAGASLFGAVVALGIRRVKVVALTPRQDLQPNECRLPVLEPG
jgi:MFS family permease